jgi:hypothetical protein
VHPRPDIGLLPEIGHILEIFRTDDTMVFDPVHDLEQFMRKIGNFA